MALAERGPHEVKATVGGMRAVPVKPADPLKVLRRHLPRKNRRDSPALGTSRENRPSARWGHPREDHAPVPRRMYPACGHARMDSYSFDMDSHSFESYDTDPRQRPDVATTTRDDRPMRRTLFITLAVVAACSGEDGTKSTPPISPTPSLAATPTWEPCPVPTWEPCPVPTGVPAPTRPPTPTQPPSPGGTPDLSPTPGENASPTPVPGITRFDDESREATASAIQAILEAQGYTVTEGCYYVFEVQDCSTMDSCYGNNPTSPYSLYAFPNIGEAPADELTLPRYQTAACQGVPEDEVTEDYYAAWRVREDEAFLYFGRTPPECAYFGQTAYLFDRDSTVYDDTSGNERTTVFASLGDTLNHLRMSTGGAGPFDEDIVLVTTADSQVFQDIRAAVLEAGVAESLINLQVIPLAVPEYKLNMSWEEDADIFGWVWRAAVFSDQAAADRFLKTGEAPVKILRVTPNVPRTAIPLPVPELIPRGNGVTEESLLPGLQAALEELGAAIREQHPGVVAINASTTALELTGSECIVDGTNCWGDNRDAAYYRNITGRRLGDDDYFIVFGVNHEAAGKAIYSNISIYYLEMLLGIDAITSQELAGSTHAYLPEDSAFRDDLYVVEVRRDCEGAPYCLEVPLLEKDENGLIVTPGLPEDATAVFVERAYVDPATGVGPAPEELLLFEAWKVQP